MSVHFFTTPRIYDLDAEVADAKARLHRSIAQRARWARHDFLREIGKLREQTEFMYPPVVVEARTVEAFDWRSVHGRGLRLVPIRRGDAFDWTGHKM